MMRPAVKENLDSLKKLWIFLFKLMIDLSERSYLRNFIKFVNYLKIAINLFHDIILNSLIITHVVTYNCRYSHRSLALNFSTFITKKINTRRFVYGSFCKCFVSNHFLCVYVVKAVPKRLQFKATKLTESSTPKYSPSSTTT